VIPTFRLDVANLSVARGGADILRNVSLSFCSGELVAVLGPSGSGKSTLLRAMNGFCPGKGRVFVFGRNLYDEMDALKQKIGFVPQDDVLHPSLSVDKTLLYAADLRLPVETKEEERKTRVADVLRDVELQDRRQVKVKNLSGGQRKRVAIAVELLAKPPLFFLDEPTSGLDPALEEKMMSLFRSLTAPDRLTLVTTHILASLQLVDLVVIVAGGRLVFVGPPKEAKPFFGAEELADIYRKVGETPTAEWARKLEASSLYKTFVLDRLGGRA
jgi:ABC-type multidrug transport system ATPase subunit